MKLAELFESYHGYRVSKRGIHLYGGDLGSGAHFDDKDEYLKMCLRELKGVGNHSEVKHWIKFCRNAGYDYPEFKDIEKSIGKIEESQKPNDGFYSIDKDSGKEVYIRYSDHHEFIKYLLQRLKRGDNGSHEVHYRIQMCRDAGYEYPEFEAIEKSLGPIEEESNLQNLNYTRHINEGNPDDGITTDNGIVKFKDHLAFIKLCLHELKHGSTSEVRHWIEMARDCGYDYPEFKVIERSIGWVKPPDVGPDAGLYTIEGTFIRYSNHDVFIKFLLQELRNGSAEVKHFISLCRKAGYDYPEFETIEKSIGKVPGKQTEAVMGNDGIKFITANGYKLVKFSDKDAIMKRILKFMKNDNCEYEVQYCINACRKAGYDYPEFKVIEKSIGKEE